MNEYDVIILKEDYLSFYEFLNISNVQIIDSAQFSSWTSHLIYTDEETYTMIKLKFKTIHHAYTTRQFNLLYA